MLWLALCLGLILGACSSTSSDSAGTSGAAAGAAGGQSAFLVGAGPTDSSVDAALADGSVSFAEYEAAVQRTVDCVRDAWGDVITPLRRSDGAFGFSLSATQPEAMAFYDQCRQRFLDPVEIGWLNENAPSLDEQARMQEAFNECVEAAGFDPEAIDDDAARSPDASEVRERCMVDSGLSVTFEEPSS